jgi:beta-lactamase regulating signal transducer with metallopeptidase domain
MMAESISVLASWWIGVLAIQSVNVCVVFVVVLMLTRALRRLGPSLHLVLWCLVFARLLLPPGLSHQWSFGALTHRVVAEGLSVGSHRGGEVGVVAVESPAEVGATTSKPPTRHGSMTLAVLWLLGSATALTMYRRRLKPFHDRLRAAGPIVDDATRELTERWRRCLHVRRRVRIVTSSTRSTPFTVGIFRPVIYLPRSVIDDRRLLESVIAHEMAHVAHWDSLWLSLQHVLQAVYFFHPLVWMAGARLDAERERLCDATVVAAGRIPACDYVGGLLNLLQLDLQGVGAPTMSARTRRIGMRIIDILARDGARRPRLMTSVAAAATIGIFLLPLGGGAGGAEPAVTTDNDELAAPVVAKAAEIEFGNPLPGGRVTWRWGPGLDPWSKEKVFHRGIDVAAKTGTDVMAPADGTVIVATEEYQESPASGTVIVIDHGGGWTTFFAHLGSLEVTEDQVVSRRQVIAKVGSTGKSTGPHIHFEVRHDGQRLDPADFVTDWK